MHETLSKIAIGLYKKPFLLLCLMHLIVAFLIVTLFLTRNVFAQQIFHVDGAIAGNSFSFPLLALLILLLPLSFLSVSVKVKNSLKDSQDFIRKITDTIPNILYVYDIAKSRNILVNSQVFDILGYTVDEIQDLGAAFLQTLMHPDDFARLHEHFAKFDDLQDGEYCEFEYRMRHKNGDWRWLSSRETIFKRDENGKIEQILGTAQDITERKSIQDLLEESEKFNRSIIESSDDCIKILDLEGNLLYLNPRGMELLEIEDSASCIGSVWTEFWEGAARKLSQIAVEEAKAGGIGKFQSPCKTQRGTNKWWDVSVTPITDLQGKIRQLLVISRDITQYKLADEELRRSEERYRNVVETQTELVCRYLPDSTLTFVNEAYCRFFNKTREELIGKKFLKFIPESVRSGVELFIQSLVANPQVKLIEHEVLKENGEIGWQQWIDYVITDSEGNLVELQGIGRDITERKLIEEKLRRKELFFRTLLENAYDIITVLSPDGTIIYESPASERIFGYSPGERIGTDCFSHIHPEDLAKTKVKFLEGLNGEESQFVEYRYRHKNGSWLYLEVVGRRAVNELGETVFIANKRNVTERRAVKKALRESEEHFRSVTETASDAIITVTENGSILTANLAVEQIFGYQKHELINQPILILIPDTLHADYVSKMSKYVSDMSQEITVKAFEIIGRHKSGREIALELSLSEFTQGDNRFFTCIARDVTERRQASENLRRSEERFQSFMNNSPAAAWITDEEGRVEYLNSTYRKLIKLPDQEIMGKSAYEVFPEEFAAEYSANIAAVAQSGESVQTIEPGVRPDGSMGIFLVYKFPLESETSSKRLVGGIGIDITEQKQTEDALKKSEEKFRQIVDTTYEGVWIVDTEAKTVFVNRRTTEMMGYAESEMMGRPTHDFVDEEMSARVEANLKRRRQGITEQYDFRLRRKDGSDLWVIVSASPLQDEKGEFYSTLTLLTDITERKKAEETRSFLASIVHSSNDAIISFDFFRQIVSWNDSAAKIFGYTAEEIIGQPLSILAPRELQQEQMEITEKIWRGETVQQYETVGVRKNGKTIDISQTLSLVKDEDQKFLGVMGIVQDITERKQTEKSLRELTSRLLKLQDEERRRIARELHDQTAQNLALIIINLSELRNILSSDDIHIQHLLEQNFSLLNQSVKEVRTLSYVLHPPMLDDNGLIPALSWYIEGYSRRSGINVSLILDEPIGRLPIDVEMALYRVVQESLTNIHRHADGTTASIKVIKETGKIVLQIKDNGRGWRVKPSGKLRDDFNSLGVGIMGMRQRLQQLGGNLEIESGEKGTIVTATVPLEI